MGAEEERRTCGGNLRQEGEQSPEDAKAKAGFPRESQEGVGPADTQQDLGQ